MPVSARDDSDVVSNPFKTKITVISVYHVVPALCLFLREMILMLYPTRLKQR